MKIGLIGAGNWGKNLASNLHELGALAWVAEQSEELRGAVAVRCPGVEIVEDFGAVLDGVDAVAIATPVPTHYEIGKRCLEAGKDVFIEKPLTLDVDEAESLVRLARERGRVLMVGHLLLYQPAIAWLKDYLDAGNLGKVFSYHQERMKLGRARRVENVTWSLGVHDVAVLLHLAGEAPTSQLYSGHCGLQSGIEDDAYLHMTFSGGRVAHLHNSWLWPENRRRLTVVGEKGMLVYDEVEQTVVLHRKTIDGELNNVDEGVEEVFTGSGAPLKLEMEHFIECIRERRTPRSDGQNGLDVVKVLASATGGDC